MELADAKYNDCDCEIPYCDCEFQYSDYYRDEEALTQENQECRTTASYALQKLVDEVLTIRKWEMSISPPLEKCVTLTKYLAFKLSRQKIIDYMGVYSKCECCSRHTGRNNLPNLPKIRVNYEEPEEPNACHCNCRHNIRHFNRALAIIL